jgi:hypothetical protein
MSKFLLVCSRAGSDFPLGRVLRACEMLAPDNISARPSEIRTSPGLALAITSPVPPLPLRDTSACLGQFFGPCDRWWEPGSAVPDGSFALVRADEARVELATDAAGSRSIFFASDDHLFVASTSQRVIAAVLGRFRLSPRAVSWVVSAGNLGPGGSWDEATTRLGPDDRVVLDRATWKLSRIRRPVVFAPEAGPDHAHESRLRAALHEVSEHIDLAPGAWWLPLSGGYDSRFLLLSLAQRHALRCITWGAEASFDDPRSDAGVARVLAARAGVPHECFALDRSTDPPAVLFDRFLANGEGCVENIGAYMDGFEVWRRLHDQGVFGIIRGDEGFGWQKVGLERTVRWIVGATMLEDLYPPAARVQLGLAEQEWPRELARGRRESIATWRDRLYHAFRLPVVLASLTDLKAPYVEVVNPLLARRVLETARMLPDHLRTDKLLFRRIVEAASPPVQFARHSAIPMLRRLVDDGTFLQLVRREVLAGREEGSLPPAFADLLLRQMPVALSPKAARTRARELLKSAVRAVVPLPVRSAMLSLRTNALSPGTLAFRAAIVARMARTLTLDAASAMESRREAL